MLVILIETLNIIAKGKLIEPSVNISKMTDLKITRLQMPVFLQEKQLVSEFVLVKHFK